MRTSVVIVGCLFALAASAQHTLTGELGEPATPVEAKPLVLVAGATGRTGREILAQLVTDERYAVRALARDAGKARAGIPGDIAWVAGDVTKPETLVPAMQDVSYVLCAIGATDRSGPNSGEFVDYRGVENLANAAKAAGVRHFVLVSSAGVESGGGVVGWILNLVTGDILVWKALGEAALRRSGVPYTIIRPGGLSNRAGGEVGLALSQGDKTMGSISRADVASVVIAAMGNPAAINRTFEILSDKSRPVDAWRQDLARLRPD